MTASSTKRTIIVVGYPHHGRLLCALIERWCRGWKAAYYSSSHADTLRAAAALSGAAAMIVFGGPAPNSLLSLVARRRRVPVVVLWAGSDVTKAIGEHQLMSRVLLRHFHHVAVAPWLVDELRATGVEASEMRVAGVEVQPAVPLGRRFAIVTYLPEPRREFYGSSRIFAIARAMPEVPILVSGPGEPDATAPPNVRYVGVVPPEPLLDSATVYVRLCDHDGLSMMVIEALARGRYCVWTHALPGVATVDDADGAIAVLRDLKARHEAATLGINEEGRRYVAESMNPERIAQQIIDRIEEFGRRERSAGFARPVARVAVSGHSTFVQRIAERLEKHGSPWQFDFLETDSRSHILHSMWLLFRCDVWYIVGTPQPHRFLDAFARLLRKPTIFHWIGSDIPFVRQSPELTRRWKRAEVTHLAEASWTLRELSSMGISASVAALPVRLAEGPILPLPEQFTILFYIPNLRPDFYGRLLYERLVQRFAAPDVTFLVVGGGEFDPGVAANVNNIGWTDSLEAVYARTTVLVRMTKRDGLSLMVLEALSHGRYVLWPQTIEYVDVVDDYEALERRIADLLARHRAGDLHVRTDAAAFVRAKFSDEETVGTLMRHWTARLPNRRLAARTAADQG